LELGGKSPCIVDRTADLNIAAKRICWGAYLNAGQTCVRPDYLLVDKAVADNFVRVLARTVTQFYGAQPQRSQFFGRLINDRAHKRVRDLIGASKQYIAFGGDMDEKDKYVAPTVLDFGVDETAFAEAPIMQEEIFGPVLPLLQYNSLDQAIKFVNSREKPLGLYCFTTSSEVEQRVLRETSSGSCDINDVIMHMTNHDLPFGGVGLSGMGSYHGKRSFDTFSHRKSVLIKTNWLDVPQRYPPYSKNSVRFLGLVQKPRPRRHIQIVQWLFWLLVIFYVYRQRKPIKKWLMTTLMNLVAKYMM